MKIPRQIPRNTLVRTAVIILIAATADRATAQPIATRPAPDPLPMGTAYYYQPGNPYYYQPVPSYSYPFGSTAPVFGRYSWDYGVYYPYSPAWYRINYPVYGYVTSYRDAYGRTVTVHVY